jgi:hypothetical protein
MEGTTRLTRSTRTSRMRLASIAIACLSLVSLSACEVGSTDISGGATGPTETAATGPAESTATTQAATGPTGAEVIVGVWEGTWGNEQFPDFGTFSMEIEPTSGGFAGTMQIQRSTCVTNGTVTIGLDGDQITVGVVQAEQEISFTGTVSGDEMSGAWDNHGDCPPPRTGVWAARRTSG